MMLRSTMSLDSWATLPATTLDGIRSRAVAHEADSRRLIPLFRRLDLGHAIVLGVIGASVASNSGCLDQPRRRCMHYSGRHHIRLPWGHPRYRPLKGFAVRFLEHINKSWPHKKHRINNTAADKTPAAVALQCLMTFLPVDLDIVLLEFNSMARHQLAKLHAIEGIVRQLASLASQPVLIIVSVHSWCLANFVVKVETEANRVCQQYGIVCLSQRRALEPLVQSGNLTRQQLVGKDCIHPVNGPLGVSSVTEMLTSWFDRAHHQYRQHQLASSSDKEHQWVVALPAPLWPANALPTRSRCYAFSTPTAYIVAPSSLGQQIRPLRWLTAWCAQQGPWLVGGMNLGASTLESLHSPACFAPTIEARTSLVCPEAIIRSGGAEYEKFLAAPPSSFFYCRYEIRPPNAGPGKISTGVIALTPGATLHFDVEAAVAQNRSSVTAHLSYLTSYQGMGMAILRCFGGCKCHDRVIDAHDIISDRDSVFQVAAVALNLRRHARCAMQLQLLNQTSSGGHKFKVRLVTLDSSDVTSKS